MTLTETTVQFSNSKSLGYDIWLNYFACGRGAKYCDKRVCVSVCGSRISQKARPNFTKFSVYVTSSRGSVFVWRQFSRPMLCIRGFVDDVVFYIAGQTQIQAWSLRRSEILTRLVAPLNCAHGNEVWYYQLPCWKLSTSKTSLLGTFSACHLWIHLFVHIVIISRRCFAFVKWNIVFECINQLRILWLVVH